MNEKEIAKWRKIREEGGLRYILLHGVLYYGIPLAFIISLISSARNIGFTAIFSGKVLIGSLVTSIWLGSIIGVLYGLITWSINNKKMGEN